ncbi:MAG TPA: histidine kinase [Microbacteriaceae bacterium]
MHPESIHTESRIPRWIIEPLIGLALLIIWAVGFSSQFVSYIPMRADMLVYTTPYALLIAVGFAAAIGLSRVATTASLVLVGALLAVQLVAWPARFSLNSWSAYPMLLVFALLIGCYSIGRMRMVAPVALVAYSFTVTALLALPRFSGTGIDGLINGKHLSTAELLPDVAIYAGGVGLATIGFWYLGTRIRRASEAMLPNASDQLPPALRGTARALVLLRPALEPAVAIVFYVLWIVAEAGRSGAWPWPSFPFTLGLLAASIAVSRHYPRLAVALPGVVLSIQLVAIPTRYSSTTWPVYFAVLLTCLMVSANASGRIRWLTLPIMGGYTVIVTVLMAVPGLSDGYGWGSWTGQGEQGARISNVFENFIAILIVGLILTAGAWFIGFGLRASRLKQAADAKLDETVDELHSAEIDLIIASERDRIAQDVHDIMAHSLSVIIAQADGARFIGPQRPEAISESLERIAASARTSLTEVRMLIESLVDDPDGHSNPTLDNLDDLIERMRGAGLAITVDRFGEDAALSSVALSSTQQLAVYRITQESLTNALKHAGAQPTARITLDWRGPGLALTVASSGTPRTRPEASAPGRGHCRGLYGMRERHAWPAAG